MAKDIRPSRTSSTSISTSRTRTPQRVTKSVTKPMPSEEQIRARAYEIYCARNGGPGDAASDWQQAERELTAEYSTRM